MANYLIRVGVEAGINLALILPVILAALVHKRFCKPALKSLLLFVCFFVLTVCLMFSSMLFEVIPFWGGWPWQSNLVEVLGIVLLVALVPGFTAKRFGFQLSTRPRSWRSLAICCILYIFIAVPLTLWSVQWHLGFNARLPEYLFEAVLPGVVEELWYRGLLLSLLNEGFGRPWKVGQTPFGWGGIIIIVLFGTLHGVAVSSKLSVHVYWSVMFLPGLVGIVLTWLKERSGSVWPGVVFHNFVDLVNTIME